MKSIQVNTASSYQVLIGSGLLSHLGQYVASVHKGCRVAIISDTNVWPLYGSVAEHSLKEAGFCVCNYTFTAGENSKNVNTYTQILEFLAAQFMTRSDCILALGGGVVGDMAGFAAATYLRGIPYIQVPTSLLAMVDSSVGGKTAIDLSAGKNLVGAFYQPELVLCDTDTLRSLPQAVFTDGCGEIVKYAVLFDPELFSHLTEHLHNFDQEYVISKCVQLKANTVETDEFDKGMRQLLNLGHTVGHAIETCSNYQISHGNAVSAGMMIVAKAAVKQGLCTEQCADRIRDLLQKLHLMTNTPYDCQSLFCCALSDKKRSADRVNLIVPKQIGNCIIHNISTQELRLFIEAGL